MELNGMYKIYNHQYDTQCDKSNATNIYNMYGMGMNYDVTSSQQRYTMASVYAYDGLVVPKTSVVLFLIGSWRWLTMKHIVVC